MRGHRIVLTLMVTALLAGACGGPAARQTDIPRLEGTLPRTTTSVAAAPATCRLAVGTGLGAQVVRLTDGSPAAGLLEPGDIVVGFDGRPVTTAADLITAVRASDIGAVRAVAVVRDAEELSYDVEVRESTITPGRPVIGVEVTTHVDLVDIEAAAATGAAAPTGISARLVQFQDGGRVFVLDPLAGEWAQLLPAAPPPPWISTGDTLLTLVDNDDGTLLVDVLDGTEVVVDTRRWGVRWLLGAIGGNVLAVADRGRGPDNDLSSLEGALLAVDPTSGDIVWEWLPGTRDEAPLVPLIAFVAPDAERVVVGLGAAAVDTEDFSYVVLDADGRPETQWPPPTDGIVPEGGHVLGWYDGTDLLFITDRQTGLFRFTPGDEAFDELTLPVNASPTRIWPLGDGRHVILQTDTEMMLVAGDGSPFARRLTEGCVADSILGRGWGGQS